MALQAQLRDMAMSRELSQSAANAVMPILRRMQEGKENARILVCSDSTLYPGNSSGGKYAAEKLYDWLLQQFPAYAGESRRDPNTGTGVWPAATAVPALGAPNGLKLYMFNAAKPATMASYFYGQYFEKVYGPEGLAGGIDLIIFNHGKNHDSTQSEGVFVGMTIAFLQQLMLRHPYAGVIICAQTPNPADNFQDVKARAVRIAAGLTGATVADFYADFNDYVRQGGTLTDLFLGPTDVHQNQLGDDRMAAVFKRLFTGRLGQFVPPRCSLAEREQNLLLNGDFASYTTSTFDNWASHNVTQDEDTVNFETAGKAALLTTVAGGSSGYIQQDLTGNAVKRHLGKYMTLAVRVRIPTGAGQTLATIGAIELHDGATGFRSYGYVHTEIAAVGRDGFFWVAVSGLIRPTATTISVRLFGCGGATTTADRTAIFDRAILVAGVLPKDMI